MSQKCILYFSRTRDPIRYLKTRNFVYVNIISQHYSLMDCSSSDLYMSTFLHTLKIATCYYVTSTVTSTCNHVNTVCNNANTTGIMWILRATVCEYYAEPREYYAQLREYYVLIQTSSKTQGPTPSVIRAWTHSEDSTGCS